MFSDAVIQKLDSYVYFLRDPRNQEVFYIGKGEGNRVFSHADGVEIDDPEQAVGSQKIEQIKDIKRDGNVVEHFILRHGLTTDAAFEIEAALIDFVGIKNLSNLQHGHYANDFGLKTTAEIIAMYDGQPFETDKKVMLININRLFTRTMTTEEVYEATRKSWVVGEDRNKAEYAVATYGGLTREAYKINDWFPVDNRWGFNGTIAEEAVRNELVGKSIKHITVQGAAFPIRYINIK
jgi:uncharacterized protein